MKQVNKLWRWIPVVVAVLLYWPSLQLPFFSDDIIHLRGVTTVDSEYILTHADLGRYYANNYYRPVVNLILRVQHVAGITPNATLWHGIMIFTHALNTLLVGLLLKHLRTSSFVQFTTILIFAVFPFNYQVVVWVLAWFHSLALLAILVTCVAALRYLEDSRRYGMLVLAILAGCIAPFIHENGIFAAGMLLLILVCVPQKHPMKALRVLVPSGLAAGVYFYLRAEITNDALPIHLPSLLYLLPFLTVMPHRPIYATQEIRIKLPHQRWLYGVGAVVLVAMGALIILNLRGKGIWTAYHLKTAYFVQGMSFPLQFLTRYAPLSPERQVWLGGVLFGWAWLAVFGLTENQRRLLVLGMGWFGLTCILPILKLNDGYTLSSPRLFYVGAPAIALTFALLLEHVRGYNRFVSLILLAGIVFISVDYVQERQGLHLQLDAAYDDLLRELPTDENAHILIANAPRWMASDDNPFPLDTMGAVFVPDYFPFEEYLRVNTGQNYAHVTLVTDTDTMYLWDRVTAIGDPLDHATFVQLAEEQDFVYTFHMGE